MEDSTNIHTRIRKIRQNLGLTMEDFGKKFTPVASKGVVSNWENGYNFPNNERIKRIAELGNVTVDYLLEGKVTFKEIYLMPTDEREKYLNQTSNSIKYEVLQYMSKKYTTLDDFETIEEAMLLYEVFYFIDNFIIKNNISAISDLTRSIRILHNLNKEFSIPTLSEDAKVQSIYYHEDGFTEENNKLYKDVTDILKDKLKPE